MSESLKSRREYQSLLKQVKAVRAQPDHVPEFPPSRLIDDSPEAGVRALQQIRKAFGSPTTNGR